MTRATAIFLRRLPWNVLRAIALSVVAPFVLPVLFAVDEWRRANRDAANEAWAAKLAEPVPE